MRQLCWSLTCRQVVHQTLLPSHLLVEASKWAVFVGQIFPIAQSTEYGVNNAIRHICQIWTDLVRCSRRFRDVRRVTPRIGRCNTLRNLFLDILSHTFAGSSVRSDLVERSNFGMTGRAHKVALQKMGLYTFLIEGFQATWCLHSITK